MERTSGTASNPWKLVAIALIAIISTALIAGLVVANYRGGERETSTRSTARSERPPARVAADAPARRVNTDDVRVCNEYASTNKAKESFKSAVIGSALGAAVGAASGAIAKGGEGAGKGAGIGAVIGAAGGTLYGLNKANEQDARSVAAYQACMKGRGY